MVINFFLSLALGSDKSFFHICFFLVLIFTLNEV